MQRHLIASGFFASLLLIPAPAETVITVSPYKHLHVYESGATGFTWYWGHLRSAANRDEVFRWLFEDLHIDYIRTRFTGVEASNDNDDPRSLDLGKFQFSTPNESNEWVYRQAKPMNPRLKIITYAHGFPDWLRKGDMPDRSNRKLFEEHAEWLFGNLVNLKQANHMDCDILDLCNEPDFDGYGKDMAADIVEKVVPLLRGWVNDPKRNPYGVVMPRIMAPSCLSASAARSWLVDWQDNRRTVWKNIDIVSTHQYGGGFDAENYVEVNKIRDGRPFMQSEMHCAHSSVLNNPGQLPDDSVEDQLEAALVLGRLFTVAVNNGVSVYDYYMGTSPQDGATSLISTPRGATATRRKVYFAFKQLSSMQTRGSNVVVSRIAGGDPGCETIAYHHGTERKAWITVTNSGDSTQPVVLKLLDKNGSRLSIREATTYETSASRDAERVANEVLDRGRPEYRTELPKQSLRTFEVSW